MLVCGEREAMVMAPLPTHDSAVSPCFHGCPAFLHRYFPPQSSWHALSLSFCSHQQPLPWDCAAIPTLQLPAAAPSRRPVSLSKVGMAAARTVWFSFHLGCHRSAVSLSSWNVSPLTQTIVPLWGSDPCFSSPTHWGQVQSYSYSCFTPYFLHPTEFYQCVFFSMYMYFLVVRYSSLLSAGVLHALLRLKVYSWREMYSTSTDCSSILFSHSVLRASHWL